MLKVGAALCQPRNHILLKRKALLIKSIDRKLFEAIISEVLTDYKVKELIDHLSLAVHLFDFDAFKRLSCIYCVEFVFELIEDPRHRSSMSLDTVDFEATTLEDLNLR